MMISFGFIGRLSQQKIRRQPWETNPLVFFGGHYLYGRSLEFLQLGDEHA
jgi:hypothetical protein